MNSIKTTQSLHFGFVEGMRGLAAMLVVLYHLTIPLWDQLLQLFPSSVLSIISRGYLGVPIFFVISGFVISLGTSRDKIDRGYVGRFILRRSVRLDFTYWASIAIALILMQLKAVVVGAEESFPSLSDVVLHMFYLQNLLDVQPKISVVYWTLCLEVQFYLFFLLTRWICQKITLNQSDSFHLSILALAGIYSVFIDYDMTANPHHGLFISNWHYFFIGVLLSRVALHSAHSLKYFLAWIGCEIVLQILIGTRPYIIAGVATAIFMVLSLHFNFNKYFLDSRPFKYLGKISYSLYLLHPDIGWKTIMVFDLFLPKDAPPIMALIPLICGIVASIIAAHILYVLVEKPTMQLSKKLRSGNIRNTLKEFIFSLGYWRSISQEPSKAA